MAAATTSTTTTFDDDAPSPIAGGQAPFRGRFRPDEALSTFHGRVLSGTWTLRIDDQAARDGGWLNRWQLLVESCTATPRTNTEFAIELEFVGGLTANQRSVFQLAAARWAEVIIGDLPSAEVDGRIIDDVLIRAEGKVIDGRNGILGQAGPRIVRPDTGLPVIGEMTFDSADLADMEQDGSLIDVILHEMGHVLGIGTLWQRNGLLDGSGTQNPTFNGAGAPCRVRDVDQRRGRTGAGRHTGGPGTAEGHWREATFDHELMTGYVEQGEMPLSRMTIASLQDLGYQVSFGNADDYSLPTPAARAARSIVRHRSCCVEFPGFLELPPRGGGAAHSDGSESPPEREAGA